MKKKLLIIIGILLIAALGITVHILYRYNYIPHRQYDNADFNIESYKSASDTDGDGIDDQTDILESVRQYIATNPTYKSEYYDTGYPNGKYGVCTDVVAFGLLGAGYDLMELVNNDIISNPDEYDVEAPDKNIDFRRVNNLKVFFRRNAISLTTDVHDIKEWQGGDIVIFNQHIGIVSDKRNKNGVPFIIHHASPVQKEYEEDVLEIWGKIIGHYRMN